MYAVFMLMIVAVMIAVCFFTLRDNNKPIREGYSMNQVQGGKKYCSYCGKEIVQQASVCPHCGCSVASTREPDIPSTGLNILSFFIPIVGLVLYCLYHDKAPNKAKQIGKWAIISVCVISAFWLLAYTYIAFMF